MIIKAIQKLLKIYYKTCFLRTIIFYYIHGHRPEIHVLSLVKKIIYADNKEVDTFVDNENNNQ